MDDTSGGRTDKQIRPAKETKIDKSLKHKPKKVSKLKQQPRYDFQLDMTNRYDSLSDTDSDKDTEQPEPKKKRNKTDTTKPKNKEQTHSNTSQNKLATETTNTDNDTTTTRIPKYMVPIIIDKTLDYNRLITLLNAEIGPQYKIMFTQQGIKVLSTTTHAYNTAKDAVKKNNIHFHTFTPRDEKSHSAILKGLPASIDSDIKKQELTEHHIHFQYIEQFTSKTGQGPERTIRKQGIFKVIIPDCETELLHKIDEISRTTVYWEEYQPRTDDIPSVSTVRGGHTQKQLCLASQMHQKQTGKTRRTPPHQILSETCYYTSSLYQLQRSTPCKLQTVPSFPCSKELEAKTKSQHNRKQTKQTSTNDALHTTTLNVEQAQQAHQTQIPSHNTTHQTTTAPPPLLTHQQIPNKNTTTPNQQSTQEHNTNNTHSTRQTVTFTINYITELLDFLRDPLIMDILTHFQPYMEQTRLEMDKGRRRHIVLEAISTYLAQDYD
ncbi:hypothetical protein PR048_030478 [Dryococelus australis]|uniref:Uncharacterized protein n=1 Tax=Dryococelus australis TaxID=614101 RepID=A0ABQ9G9W3_9NEOP|nr:hypothetical protein PR048_030478 [Dryococelus australis]